MTSIAVYEQLTKVTDPCSAQLGRPMDLVTMGLVQDVEVDGGTVRVRLVLTDSSCIFFFAFADQIEERLLDLPDVDHVEVTVDTDMLWTPDRIKDSQHI